MKDMKRYQTIEMLAKASGLTRRDINAFYQAYEAARDASNFDDFSLGCIITVGGQVVASGGNQVKTDPTQKQYNLQYRHFHPSEYSNREHSLHAEMSAIKALSYPLTQKINWKRAKAYIFRIAPGLPYGQGAAAPCCACAHALADLGIQRVLFSTEYGFASSRLSVKSGLVLPDGVDYPYKTKQESELSIAC